MKAYVLLLTLLIAACGDTLDAASQATWWKTKEAMCGREMREWSKYADRRNKIVDRITQECYTQDNQPCTAGRKTFSQLRTEYWQNASQKERDERYQFKNPGYRKHGTIGVN